MSIHRDLLFTHDPVPVIAAAELEDILLVAVIREVVRLYLNGELLYERASVAGLGIRISIPRLLLGDQRRFRQQAFEPARQMTAHMVNLVCVLPVTARPVVVRLIFDYLHAAAGASALLAGFFLRELHGTNDTGLSIALRNAREARKVSRYKRYKGISVPKRSTRIERYLGKNLGIRSFVQNKSPT